MKRYMFVVTTKENNRLVALYSEEAPPDRDWETYIFS